MIEYIYFGALAIAGVQDMMEQRIYKFLCWMMLITGIIMFMGNISYLNLGIVAVEVVYIIMTSRILKVGFGDVIIWISLCFALVDKSFIPIIFGIISAMIYAKLFKKDSIPLIPFTVLGLVLLVIL
ncbi:hypothetical protein [Methanothermococcus sp.]|uniref:hypothetical protein n=1 Tax=Methanothermococcus sp. TaxID=2614238 RepID=UPI002601430E|nr:hypothetical protein [Methanothermococcus sp.]